MATIITKNSSTASSVPLNTQLVQGELAVNVTDKRLFTENASGTVVELGTNPSSLTLPNGVANAVCYLNGSKVLTTGSALVFDGTNLGLGVTPSAWGASYTAFQLKGGGSLHYDNSGNAVYLGQNVYGNAGNKYISTAAASLYAQGGGAHYWYTAPSGTAGNAISFTQAMTLDASVNLGLNTSSPVALNSGGGYFTVNNATSGGGVVFQNNSANIAYTIADTDGLRFDTFTGKILKFGIQGTERARIDSSGNFLPGADNAYSCGNSGRRWNAVWAAIGTIQTSDEREKTEIVDSPLGLDFIKSLRPVAYKFRVGGNVVSTDEQGNEVITPVPGKRQHFGLLAQQVKQTLGETDFGGWILTDPDDAESEQGLRYDEFISPLIKAIQEQQAIIEQLKADVAALKGAA